MSIITIMTEATNVHNLLLWQRLPMSIITIMTEATNVHNLLL